MITGQTLYSCPKPELRSAVTLSLYEGKVLKLRVTALLSSGCRATVESLSSVHSGRANCTCHVGKVQSIFISGN